jgi:AcrR family transcriptional regulator
VPSTTSPTRRAQRREATLDDIRTAARSLLAADGPEAVTLRGIASRLSMAAAGVHYYYPSRDDLLTALVLDAFHELNSVTGAAARPAPGGRCRTGIQAWTDAALAYRSWALTNPELFQLAHSSTATRLKARPGLLEAKDRAVRALTDPLAAAVTSGEVELPARTPVPATLRAHFKRWADVAGVPRDPRLLLFLVQAYTLVHGAVVLNVTRSLPLELLEDDALFRAQLALISRPSP